jgi:hypothetical protein
VTAIRYEDLIDVADVAQHWYAGQGDPVYALVSSVYAGWDVPLPVAEDALTNLERDYRQLKVRRPEGWRKDYDELGRAIDELQFAINETRAHVPNPLAMGDGEKIAIAFGLAAGLGAILYYALAAPAKPVTVQV